MTRFALLPLLALAACRASPDANATEQASFENQLNAPVKEIETLPPDETVVEQAAGDAATQAAATVIPESMRGRWGLVPADCTSTKGDNKGLLTVGADTLSFYESRAKLGRMVASSPEKLTAEFAFTGEGQNWTRTETLSLTNSSNTLVREDDELPQPLRYSRCPTR